MRVIILAAGFGKRLGKNKSKGLVEIDGDDTFLDKQFEILNRLELRDVVIVAGKDYQNVKDRYGDRCVDVIHNERVEMNNGYSLLLASNYMRDGFLLVNCDVMFESEILDDLINHQHANCLVVDENRGFDPEEMKACAIHGVPYRLKKEIIQEDRRNMIGEFAGICKVGDQDSVHHCIDILQRRTEKGEPFYWEDALEEHMSAHRYGVSFTGEKKWIEVDFMEDYHKAKKMFGFR